MNRLFIKDTFNQLGGEVSQLNYKYQEI
jgi:hypothetical protein